MDAPSDDSVVEDLSGPMLSGPETNVRARVMFFVALLFLFGFAIILPPNSPKVEASHTEQVLQPVTEKIQKIDQDIISSNPDLVSIQTQIYDLRNLIEGLPDQLDKIVAKETERLTENPDAPAPEEATSELPSESAAVKIVSRLFVHPWFLWTMTGLWGWIILDGIVGVYQATDGKFKAMRRLWLVALIPPMRMAFSPARPNEQVWFPRSGWLPVNKESSEVMELVLAMPMLLMTLSIVPIEIVERFFPHWVLGYPTVSIVLHLLGACIWIAFVVEFIMLFGLAQNKIAHCKQHWVNLIIIILPLIAFLRVLRVTRLVRIIRAGKLMRVYRIRGVYVRAMRVAVLFSLVDRLLSKKPEKYLAKLEHQIAEKRAELANLEQNAEDLRLEIENSAPTE
ncbi:MAG: hypothetical protein P1V20_04520 [Verrucomicrobiales bacterium]|nr:hypothetical protein [Verrucomicrobiales bacterium]